jgi:hypothetical protein
METNLSLKLIITRLVKKFIAVCSFLRVYTRPQTVSYFDIFPSIPHPLFVFVCNALILYTHRCAEVWQWSSAVKLPNTIHIFPLYVACSAQLVCLG